MQISPYQGYAGDLNEDNQINITDIILLIDIKLCNIRELKGR